MIKVYSKIYKTKYIFVFVFENKMVLKLGTKAKFKNNLFSKLQ